MPEQWERSPFVSLYDDIGLPADATTAEIAAAYRRLSKKHHPDAGGDPDTFAKISRAVAVLRDPQRRAEYDKTGREDFTEVSPDAAAIAALSAAFDDSVGEFMDGKVRPHVDLIDHTKKKLLAQARAQRAEIDKMRDIERRALDARSRLRHLGDGPDPIGAGLTAKLEQLAVAIVGMTDQAAAFERGAEMIDQWAWRADEAPAEGRVMTIQELINTGVFTQSEMRAEIRK